MKDLNKVVFVLGLLFCLFRFPIGAAMGGINPRLFILAPILITLSILLLRQEKFVVYKQITSLTKIYALFYFLSVAFSVSFFVIDFNHAKESIPPFLFSTVFSSIFIFFIVCLSWRATDWVTILNKVSSVVILGGGGVFIISTILFRKGVGYSIDDYIAPELISVFLYPNVITHPSQRTVGFLISLESSGLAILVCTLLKTASFTFLKPRRNISALLNIMIGCVSTFLSTSLTLTLGLLCGVGVIFFLSDFRLKYKVWLSLGSVLTMFCMVLLGYYLQGPFSVFGRAWYYFLHPKTLSEFWWFSAPASWVELIINFDGFRGIPSKMVVGMFNIVFVRLEMFGILPTLIWYSILFLPLFLFFKIRKMSSEQKVLFMGYFGFAFGALHYSGAESWGNNYLLFTIVGAFSLDYFLTQRLNDS